MKKQFDFPCIFLMADMKIRALLGESARKESRIPPCTVNRSDIEW
jgi:hypothetical protein